MSYFLLRITQNPKVEFPFVSIPVLAAVYSGMMIYTRLNELFLLRKVVFLGIGFLLFCAATASGIVLFDAYLVGGGSRFMQAGLALIPVHLFSLRCLMIFREARHTPSADALLIRLKAKAEKVEELRRKLRFWLS